jgi:hypothetical protein
MAAVIIVNLAVYGLFVLLPFGYGLLQDLFAIVIDVGGSGSGIGSSGSGGINAPFIPTATEPTPNIYLDPPTMNDSTP